MKVKEAIEQSRGNEAMWSQIDEALKEVAPTPPENSFCLEDFMHRQGGISRGKAQDRIRKLRVAGKITTAGRIGNKTYYQLVKT